MSMKEIARRGVESLIGRVELTGQNVDSWRGLIGKLRESANPMFTNQALELIPSLAEQAEKQGLWAHAASFWNEMSLIADRNREGAERWLKRGDTAASIQEKSKGQLRQAVTNADRIVEGHREADGMRPIADRQGLFRAKLLVAEGEHDLALAEIDKSIEAVGESETDTERANALELKSVRAELRIRLGETREGIQDGFRVCDDFRNSDLGKTLKAKEPMKAAIWYAGCVLKMSQALIDTDSLDELRREEKNLLDRHLHDSYTQGMQKDVEKFTIRRIQLILMRFKLWKEGIVPLRHD